MTKASDKKVFAQRVRKLSAQELQKVTGGVYEANMMKTGGGQDFTGRQGFE